MIGAGRRGLTLVELMIVVVILGILSTVVVRQYGRYKERAFLASASSELRNLHQTQEIYFIEEGTYAPSIGLLDFQEAAKIPVVLVESTGMGWAATATFKNTSVRCSIFYGTVAVVPPPATALDEGVPICTL